MSFYWDDKFLRHLENKDIHTIFEVGARYGDETKQLSTVFPKSKIFSFECNPITVEKCKTLLNGITNVSFHDFGLGHNEEELPFYSFVNNNDGASSLLKRIDFHNTQKQTGIVKIKRLDNFVQSNDIQYIDLLCMDVQGYELNVLKGSGDFIRNINYVIMEEPKPVINQNFLPNGLHSKYINAPTSQTIKEFMSKHNFVEIERIEENGIEDNVMYKNTRLS